MRRLSHGKGDNANAKKPNNKQRKKDERKSVELGPQHQDSTEEVRQITINEKDQHSFVWRQRFNIPAL